MRLGDTNFGYGNLAVGTEDRHVSGTRQRRPRTPDEGAFADRVGRAGSGMVSPPQGDDENDDSVLGQGKERNT